MTTGDRDDQKRVTDDYAADYHPGKALRLRTVHAAQYPPTSTRSITQRAFEDLPAGTHPRNGGETWIGQGEPVIVSAVSVRDVVPLVDALTAELASSGYDPAEMFGYSVDKLENSGVHLVGASVNGTFVGIGGVELADDGTAELKRFYVMPEHRGSGVAAAIITTLLEYSAAAGAHVVRLETGVKQHAAIRFYARHGFERIEPFGPYVGSASSVCMARSLPT